MSGSRPPAMMPPEPAETSGLEAPASAHRGAEPPQGEPRATHVLLENPTSAEGGRPPAPPEPDAAAKAGDLTTPADAGATTSPGAERAATSGAAADAAANGEAGAAPARGRAAGGAPADREGGSGLRLREQVYRAALSLARPFARGGSDEKIQRGLAGRMESVAIFERWAAEHRDPDLPLVWVHAPSAGESLMAKAIITALREERPAVQVAFTHFSPSAERLLEDIGADVAAYLPWDVRRDVRRTLDALSPSVIAYVRSEVWPVLGVEARRRGTRVALVNAALAPDSSRLRPAARWLLGPAYARLDLVGAVAADDAELHARLGARPSCTRVTGDARFDQVLARLGGDLPEAAGRLREPGRVTLVAGSTWPEDEEHLIPAYFRSGTGMRLVIAPHEPTEEHLAGIEDALDRFYVDHRRLSDILRDRHALPMVVVVDRLGILADLYRVADIAFVGGAFTENGVHSVVEPAAVGVPVILGPRHRNAREAAELVAAGGGMAVANEAQLEGRLRTLAQYETARQAAGERAAAFVRERTGGARANAHAILALIEG